MAAPGGIDVSNADWCEQCFLEAACREHAPFVVDLTRARLCAAAGLSVLVRAQAAVAEGGELRL